MTEDSLGTFQRRLAPYSGLLDQLVLRCVAVKVQERWIALYAGLTLNSSLDGGIVSEQVIEPDDCLKAFVVRYEAGALEPVLSELRRGALSVKTASATHTIFLNRAYAGIAGNPSNISPSGVIEFTRDWTNRELPYRPTLGVDAMTSDRVFELISFDEVNRITKRLRLQRPPYDGLPGLLRSMGSQINPHNSTDSALLGVRAVLPFNTDFDNRFIAVECPYLALGGLKVLCFFSSGETAEIYAANTSESNRQGIARVEFPINWPLECSQGTAHLYFGEEHVDQLKIGRWHGTSNWRLTLDSFFDPEQKFLQEALRGRAGSEAFEHAVARLLAICEIPVIWYGQSRVKGKPDLAAVYERSDSRFILLGECTLEKPHSKFSPLKARAAEIAAWLANWARVLPIVFTACEPVTSDFSNAAADGIVLVGRDKLLELLKLVQRGPRSNEVLEFLRTTNIF